MSITFSSHIVLDGLQLPPDLNWEDEFEWCKVARSAEYTLAGTQIIEESIMLSGRPITLVAKKEDRGWIWIERSVLQSLYVKAETLNKIMALSLPDGRTFSVRFRNMGVTSQPVYHVASHNDADPYALKLELMVV